jgi:ribonucleoside-diphosphate reductase beta chain
MVEQRSCHRRLTSNKLKNTGLFVKHKVPTFIWHSTRETVLEYLKGLFYTDGTTYTSKKTSSIKVTQINKEYLEEIQLLLLMFGIKSRIYNIPRRNTMLPDGKGSKKMYDCKPAYTLEITHRTSVIKLNDGIKLFELRKKTLKPFENIKKSHPITRARFLALESVGYGDVFCVEVESEFKGWVCNGFITHNSEISMASDINDWKMNLTEGEKHMIGSVLKGFTQAEIIIEDYWANKVANWFKKPEIQMAANTFAAFESIHAVSYAYLNQSLGIEDFEAFLYEPSARAKIDRLINTNGKSKEEIAKSLAIFSAFNEGVSLFSSFAILLNFSRFNKLKGVGQIISFSIRDESLHSEFGCWLFRQFIKEYPEIWTDSLKKDIYEAARLTIELEDKFIDKCFENGEPEGLKKETLKQYMRFRTNTKLQDLGLKSNWKNIDKKAIAELEWFDVLSSGVASTDFFAARVSDYSKANKDWSTIW